MKSRTAPGSVITLLLVIFAIVVLHALKDFQKDDAERSSLDASALTKQISKQ